MENLNISVFKYPLGFVRVIQFLFIVISLSAANSWHADLTLECGKTPNTSISSTVTKTFSMSGNPVKNCSGTEEQFWDASWGGAAGFFYFTNVVSLIYVLIVTFSYVALWSVYEADKRIPLADLAVTALLFVFWFFSSSIWWAAASGIGEQTSEAHVKEIISKDSTKWGSLKDVSANNGMLTISVLCGWVCVTTFALNCWFIWKEVVPRSTENPTQIA